MRDLPACAGCGTTLSEPGRLASICGNVLGDEYIDTLYRCAQCGARTLERYRDRFSGASVVRVEALDASGAEALIALVRRCSSPMNKHCDCAAHREHFGI